MSCFVIVGEASGDTHAARLIEELLKRDATMHFAGLGGEQMRAQGCHTYVDIQDMAYMGFVAVLSHLSNIKHNFQVAKQALLAEKPDVLILVDYPSFNLKMATFCRQYLPHTKIVYYIPPKVWVWKKGRIHKIAQLCDLVLGIFPFEETFYAQYGYKCRYVGNPTSDAIQQYRQQHPICEKEQVIAILPGSRRSEISHCLGTMLAAARLVAKDTYRIEVAAAPGIEDDFYTPWLQGETLTRDTYHLLCRAQAAVVNSGTATLETALLGCPETAVYYIACSTWAQWLIEPILFHLPWFTLVNIISRKSVIQELIAKRFTQENIEQELKRLLTDDIYKKNMLAEFEHIQSMLGNVPASANAADSILSIV